MARVFRDGGALAVAVGCGCQNTLLLIFSHQHGNHALRFVQHHAAHAACIAAHGAHIVFIKSNGFAAIAEKHHVVFAIGESSANQEVAFIQVDRNDAGFAGVAEFIQRCFLHGAHGGAHEHVMVGREAAHVARQRQDHIDLFAFLQGEHVDNGSAARAA